jgi:protein phosphatase
MNLVIPELSLVVLIGPPGCGKSSFARKHFKSTEVLPCDYCRELVSDDESNQAGTNDAFGVLHFIARKRLAVDICTSFPSRLPLQFSSPAVGLWTADCGPPPNNPEQS